MTSAKRECFVEGDGRSDCVELTGACALSDHICLTDDLTLALLRAGGNGSVRYAAYLARGIAAYNARRFSDAIADIEAAQSIQPELVTPLILLGRVHGDAGLHARALLSLNEAVRRGGDLPAVLLLRASVRRKAGDLEGAITDLSRALAVTQSGRKVPEGAEEPAQELLALRASAWLALQVRDKARSDAEAALALEPGHAGAREVLETLGRP